MHLPPQRPRHKPMSTTFPLSIKNLDAGYPGQESLALHDINWDVQAGELIAIIGPNGAGKSTLLKAAMGLIPQKNGQVRFFDQPLKHVRKKIAYIPQRSAVDWDFPVCVLDVATMGLYGRMGWLTPVQKRHKDKAMAALEKVGIADLAHRQIGALSGGQQQRTFLARALAQDAELYLMDEPFAGVDVPTEGKIIEILNELKSEGRTIIVVHHYLSTVERVFDTALLINQEIIAKGQARDVLTKDHLAKAYGAPLSYLSRIDHG